MGHIHQSKYGVLDRDYTYNGGANTCLAIGGIRYTAASTLYAGGDTHAGICHIKRNEVGVVFTTNGSRQTIHGVINPTRKLLMELCGMHQVVLYGRM